MKDLEILVLKLLCKKQLDFLFLLLVSVLMCFPGNSLGQNSVNMDLNNNNFAPYCYLLV